MPSLDRRLLPLLDSLGAAGADWLAFELINGIQDGKVVEETADALIKARAFAREGSVGSSALEDFMDTIERSDLSGDEQIDWAVRYVEKRLGDTIAMLLGALGSLEEIVNENLQVEGAVEPKGTWSNVTLILQENETQLAVDRNSAIDAQSALENLRVALVDWRSGVREGRP